MRGAQEVFMKQMLKIGVLVVAALALNVGSAYAWHVSGTVRCDANGNGEVDEGDLVLPNIRVVVTGTNITFSVTVMTNASGFFEVALPDVPGSYTLSISVPQGATLLTPQQNPMPFSVDDADTSVGGLKILISSPACSQQACWLTGGGAKFSTITGTPVAEKGPQHTLGGNVNPGCNPDSGEGGQWNHVAHALKRHIQGLQIRVVRCGNVPGIPEGSESPATPFNFIEFEGTGTVKPVHGNREDGLPAPINFFARAEDRNEPGSSGAKDGALIDRYFIHAWTGTTTWLLVDGDGNPSTVDPVPITDGNLQIHISSCSTPQ